MTTNKDVLTTFKFPSFNAVALSQLVFTIIILYSLKLLKLVSIPNFDRTIFRKVFPLPALFLVGLVSGLGGTKLISLPMFACLRRFNIAMTMWAEYLILGVTSTWPVKISIVLMLLGAVVAAADDLAFDMTGYIYIAICNVATAASSVYAKKKLDAKDLGTNGLVYYNSLFSFPFMLLFCYYAEPTMYTRVVEFPSWNNSWFIASFVACGIMGLLLNFSQFLCTKLNSALTTTIVGTIKNVFISYVGIFYGGDYVYSRSNFIGLNISILGSLYYSYIKYNETKPAKISPSTTPEVLPKISSPPSKPSLRIAPFDAK